MTEQKIMWQHKTALSNIRTVPCSPDEILDARKKNTNKAQSEWEIRGNPFICKISMVQHCPPVKAFSFHFEFQRNSQKSLRDMWVIEIFHYVQRFVHEILLYRHPSLPSSLIPFALYSCFVVVASFSQLIFLHWKKSFLVTFIQSLEKRGCDRLEVLAASRFLGWNVKEERSFSLKCLVLQWIQNFLKW